MFLEVGFFEYFAMAAIEMGLHSPHIIKDPLLTFINPLTIARRIF